MELVNLKHSFLLKHSKILSAQSWSEKGCLPERASWDITGTPRGHQSDTERTSSADHREDIRHQSDTERTSSGLESAETGFDSISPKAADVGAAPGCECRPRTAGLTLTDRNTCAQFGSGGDSTRASAARLIIAEEATSPYIVRSLFPGADRLRTLWRYIYRYGEISNINSN